MTFDDAAIARILAAVGAQFVPHALDRTRLTMDFQPIAFQYYENRALINLPSAEKRSSLLTKIRKAAESLRDAPPSDWRGNLLFEYTDEDGQQIASGAIPRGDWFLSTLFATALRTKGLDIDWDRADYEQQKAYLAVRDEVKQTLEELFRCLEKLIPWLDEAAKRTQSADFVQHSEMTPEGLMQAHEVLFGDLLARIYEKHFGRKAGISRPSGGGKAGGPYVRFALAVAEVLQVVKPNGEPYGPEMIKRSLRHHWNGKTP